MIRCDDQQIAYNQLRAQRRTFRPPGSKPVLDEVLHLETDHGQSRWFRANGDEAFLEKGTQIQITNEAGTLAKVTSLPKPRS